jgi:hypothetical protein
MRKYGVLALMAGAAVLAAGTAGAKTYPGNQGKTWADIAKLPQLTGVYELAAMDRVGRVAGQGGLQRAAPPELTAKAKAEQAAYRAKGAQDSDAANCLPPGMPGVMTQPYPIQLLVTPGEVTIIQEAYMQVRHVHTDGRDHPADPDLTFNGDSIGHWEGDTLVVDTVGLAPQAVLQQGVTHSKNEHIVERYHLVEPNMLEVKTTIEDPDVLAKPWETTTRYARHPEWSLAEYICEQNNRNSFENGKAGIDLTFKKAP